MATAESIQPREGVSAATATITVGVDGRVYLHDVTADILAVAATLCPGAPAVVSRQTAASETEGMPHDRNPQLA